MTGGTERSPLLEVEQLTRLLRDAEQAHAVFEQQLGQRHEDWAPWYAEYIVNRLTEPRQDGESRVTTGVP